MNRPAGSLQRRLTIATITIVGVALAALSATTYAVYRRNARERFDERLADAARAVALMVETHADRPWELEGTLLATLDQSRGASSFQVWMDDGSVLAHYPPLASHLPRPPLGAAPRHETVQLPDGSSARLYRAWVQPRPGPAAAPARRIAVAVMRDTSQLEGRLSRLRATLWVSTLGVVLLAGLVAWLVIRRSLRSVARLSASIASIDASSLEKRLDLDGLPDELLPPFAKLNELLARIERSMTREREFSADVSHELRTPLAGLRTILAVSSSRAASDHRTALREALTIVAQIEATVENLLAFARLGAGQTTDHHLEEVYLADLAQACFTPFGDAAHRRRLTFENRIAPEVSISCDRLKLRLITANLLSNAVQYTAEGGWISVESDLPAGVLLKVRDSGPPIPQDAIAKLFDPLFSIDRSRSGGGEHCGIGLALVHGLCDTLGYRVSVENEPGGAVAFTIASEPTASAVPRMAYATGPGP